MGLRKGDYEVKKGKRGYEIHVGAEAEDRLLKPRTLKSWAEDREIAAIRDGRAGDGWTMKAADGSEKPWKPEGMTDELPDGTKWELAPHQQADIKFLEQQHSVLISDEAGSGKTAAGLGAIAQLAKSGKARRWIVVVPKNTVTQWQEAAQAFLGPELAGAVEVASGDTERGKRGRMLRGEGAGDGPRIIITNHDTVRRHAGDIEEGKYDGMILDEAHYFTERQGADTAQRTEALHGLNTPYKMLMTGTPVKNDLSEFYSVVDYLQPGLLGDKAEFLQRYGKAGGSATAGHETLMRELQSEVRGVMMGTRLSRPSKGGGQELRPLGGGTGQQPVKMKETYVPVKPSASQKTGLRGVTDKFEEYRSLPGATLTRRDAEKKVINNGDAAQNAKVAAARKVLADHPGQRAILFATNVYTLDTIRAGLGLKDDEVAVLDGSMSDKQRFEVQRKLNDPKSPVRVVLATDAANTGQNLQGATVVVNVDLPDNPAIVRQRVARAWRLRPAGIRRDFPDLADTVSVYHLQSDTQYDIEQRERLRQKSKAVDLPSQMDMADDAGGIGGILQAYRQEVASHAPASA
jgi:SNF2 family DNA or RNA helicase